MAVSRPDPLLTPEGLPSRTDWSLSPGVLHLNHGSFGAVPLAAQEAQAELRRRMEANPCGWFTGVADEVTAARRRIAGFLAADVDATALVPNASAGATVVFNNVPAWSGMEVLVTDHAYGAVLMGAERLARRWGGTLRRVRVPLGADDDEVCGLVTEALTDNTGLVVVDHVTSATARVLPAGRIAAECRRRGIPVLVDAAHTPGLFAEPLQGVEPDFWVGNLHKFACTPRGTAALVAAAPLAQELHPPVDSWGAPLPYPERFDHQGTDDFTSYLAAPVALETIEDRYGWDAVRDYARALADYAQAIVGDALGEACGEDVRVDVGVPAPTMRLVALPGGLAGTHEEAGQLRQLIARKLGIETAITSWNGRGFLRLSSHVYNVAEDYEELVDRAVPFLAEQAGQGAASRRGSS